MNTLAEYLTAMSERVAFARQRKAEQEAETQAAKDAAALDAERYMAEMAQMNPPHETMVW